MKIDIETLRSALNKLLDHAKEMAGGSVEIDADLYWYVPQDAVHEHRFEPAALTLGSLHDDWAELAAMSAGTKEPMGYALVWAASVLRSLGDRVP